ncbi:hypothetical protein [Chitinophaga polysaccharea]|uniref:hypothetical protein n=1 Tax=Chitinophaga polysaccharea TaxID=1293035 RepID=UPI001158B421|nr:hypothetical protein [Chitinophaga polysaccharea]
MEISPNFIHIDKKVSFIKRSCDLVEHLIQEKAADIMLEATKKDRINPDEKKWMDFLYDMEKCIATASELKPYLAANSKMNFGKTNINISQLDYLFFMRKNTLIENLLDKLKITTEEILKNLPLQERQPFFIWKTELETITKNFKLMINKMQKYEKAK